ncbi:putative RNA-binding domain superfamily [Helianthus debilis subsp. tardiflorus]
MCGVASLGEVTGTYVAKKRDKEGHRFGFASFKDVKDKAELEGALKGVKLGGCKLSVNIARFSMVNGIGGKPNEVKILKPQQVGFDANRPFNIRDSRSYSEVLGKGKLVGSVKEAGSNLAASSLVGQKTVVVPDRTAAFREMWGKAVVGRTMDLETLVDLD